MFQSLDSFSSSNSEENNNNNKKTKKSNYKKTKQVQSFFQWDLSRIKSSLSRRLSTIIAVLCFYIPIDFLRRTGYFQPV